MLVPSSKISSRLPTPLLFIIGVIVALLVAALATLPTLRPGPEDMRLLLLLLSITAVVSVALGYLSYRLGWWRWPTSVRLTLLIGYIVAVGLVFLNVFVTAKLMFASDHDLALAGILLLFAGGIALSFGYFLSASITDSIRQVVTGAEAIADGDLSARVSVTGNDELADLARTFNRMAEQLQEADVRQKEVEALRRDLIAWVSHDLRTPLTSIRLMIEALADGVVDQPDVVRRYLHTIQGDVHNLSTLIDDLFELAQLDAGKLEFEVTPNSLHDLISDTLESMRAQAERKGIQLHGDVAPNVDPVVMAPDKISRVLNNLISNAVRHTPAGGIISVQACREVESNRVRVDIQDSGEGIPTSDIPHIFESFYRGEKSRSRTTGGAGLGLAIAKGIVESHGGRIWVDSRVGEGSMFSFTL